MSNFGVALTVDENQSQDGRESAAEIVTAQNAARKLEHDAERDGVSRM